VDLAEVEGAAGEILVDDLEPVIALGDVETDVVCIPAELLSRRYKPTLDPFAVAGSVDKGVEEHAGGLKGELVVDKGVFRERGNLVPRLLGCRGQSSFGLSDKAVEYVLNGLDRGRLRSVLVSEKTEPGMGFSRELDAKVDKFEHDGFQHVDWGMLEAFPKHRSVKVPRLWLKGTNDWNTSQRFSKACC